MSKEIYINHYLDKNASKLSKSFLQGLKEPIKIEIQGIFEDDDALLIYQNNEDTKEDYDPNIKTYNLQYYFGYDSGVEFYKEYNSFEDAIKDFIRIYEGTNKNVVFKVFDKKEQE